MARIAAAGLHARPCCSREATISHLASCRQSGPSGRSLHEVEKALHTPCHVKYCLHAAASCFEPVALLGRLCGAACLSISTTGVISDVQLAVTIGKGVDDATALQLADIGVAICMRA